jgi:ferric-dicitrate binding protein FerR (iron transport regulator)
MDEVQTPEARGEFRKGPRDQFCEESTAPKRWSRKLALVLGLAAGIAAVVFDASFLNKESATSDWSLASSNSTITEIQVDGTFVADADELAKALIGAKSVSTDSTSVRLQYKDLFVIELGEATQLDITYLPADGEGNYILTGMTGSLRLATGPDFPGHKLILRAPDLESHVLGTVFGIDIFEYGTCICCTEGLIGVRARSGDNSELRVGDDQSSFVDRTGSHHLGDVHDSHAPALIDLARFWE